jgi:murein DD-endopeptidase MepM/ murein hydrolase activator NlpD
MQNRDLSLTVECPIGHPPRNAYPRRNTLNENAYVPAVTRKEAIASERRPSRRATYQPTNAPVPPAPTPRRRPATSTSGLVSKLLAPLAMVFAGGLLVATTLPANAFMTEAGEYTPTASAVGTQELTTSDTAAGPTTADRSAYTVDEVEQWIAAAPGFEAAATSDLVVWPVGSVKMSAGFGARDAPCAACSSNHKGLDFVPGAGSPIVSVADGVVREVQKGDSGYGNWVLIDHVVDGQVVSSGYAHMAFGSITVAEGDFVSAGQHIGDVGNTGVSTGAHLHFELRVDDVQIDPEPWLQSHAVS